MTKKMLLVCAALFLGALAYVAWGSGTDRSLLLLLVAVACPLLHVFMHHGHGHAGHGGAGTGSSDGGANAPRTGA